MYRLIIFVACFAFAFGNANNSSIVSSSPSSFVSPSPIVASTSISAMSSVVISTAISNTSMQFSSTIAPNSTVMPSSKTPAPTTMPYTKPTPPPKPTHGDYSIKTSENGTFCLLAQLDIMFNISYNTTGKQDNKSSEGYVKFGMPFTNFSTKGSKCGKKEAMLLVSWPIGNPLYHFEMKFGRTNDSGWEVTEVSLNVSTTKNPVFPNATEKLIIFQGNKSELNHLSGKSNGSYLCGVDKTYPFTKDGMMFVNYAKLQPFDVPDKQGKEVFGEANNCVPKKPKKEPNSNIVPIAVGCALAGLVLIVLIAYIIGRRKSQRGYEKV